METFEQRLSIELEYFSVERFDELNNEFAYFETDGKVLTMNQRFISFSTKSI